MDTKAPPQESDRRLSRRRFIRKTGLAVGGLLVGGCVADIAAERGWIQVTRPQIAIPGLAPEMAGLTICQITDIHHGPFVSLDYVREIVNLANRLRPDLTVITGDNVHRSPEFIEPVWRELGRLAAPLGVYCVMGNHDYWEGIAASRAAQRQSGIPELFNSNVRIGGSSLWLAGVGDRWEDTQDLDSALAGVGRDDSVILLSHNPDYADEVGDSRVKLILAGHSHGGQVVLPLLGAPRLPCKRKYAQGLVATATTQAYISRGLGVVAPPIRFNCRPELPLFALAAGVSAASEVKRL